jgi:hypothetical protein
MKPKTLYLSLCVVGIVLPYWQFIPWLIANGMNFSLFFQQLFASRISSFFAMDVLVSAIALMIFVRQERLCGTARWLPLIAVVTVGVSLALPLFLYLCQSKRS